MSSSPFLAQCNYDDCHECGKSPGSPIQGGVPTARPLLPAPRGEGGVLCSPPAFKHKRTCVFCVKRKPGLLNAKRKEGVSITRGGEGPRGRGYRGGWATQPHVHESCCCREGSIGIHLSTQRRPPRPRPRLRLRQSWHSTLWYYLKKGASHLTTAPRPGRRPALLRRLPALVPHGLRGAAHPPLADHRRRLVPAAPPLVTS